MKRTGLAPGGSSIGGRVGLVGVLAGLTLQVAWPAEPRSDPMASGDKPGTADELAPAVTLTDIARITDGFELDRAMYRLLATADRNAVERLLEEIGSPAKGRREMARVAYLRLAALDPEAAVEHVLARNLGPSWVAAVFRTWAHGDVDAAVARASTLQEGARMAVARALLELDMPPARLRDIARRLEATELLIESEIRTNRADIEEIWSRAVSNTADPLRDVRLEMIAEIWSAEDPVAALAAVGLVPAGELRDELRALIVEIWSSVDPGAAATWFSTAGLEDIEHVEASFAALAERDVSRAWSLTGLLPSPRARNRSREAVLEAALVEDFDGAFAFFDTLTEDEGLPTDFAMYVLAGLGDRPSEALEWAVSRDEASGNQSSRRQRDVTADASGRESLMQWTYVFGGRNPTLAKRVIEDVADEATRDWAVAAYLALGRLFGPTAWRGRDTRADIVWAESVTSDEFLLQPEVTKILMRLDSDHAIEAILRREPGPARDEALTVAVGRANVLADEHVERLLGSMDSADARRRVARQTYLRGAGPGDGERDVERRDFLAFCRYEFGE